MNMEQYFKDVYYMYKLLFNTVENTENPIIIGSIREEIIKHLLSFFSEPKESGWIFSNNNTTGQIDIILPYFFSVSIPGFIFNNNVADKGFFSNQVVCAVEVKSNISSKINEIINKTWSCHRLLGGFENRPLQENVNGQIINVINENWVPFIVIGNNGFTDDNTYYNHFSGFSSCTYKVNKIEIQGPRTINDVIPDILLDLKYNKLLIHKHLNPLIVEKKLNIQNINNFDSFSILTFEENDVGLIIKIMLYYIEVLRKCLIVSQLTVEANLLGI